jgi:iron complex outermembrane recepter protein
VRFAGDPPATYRRGLVDMRYDWRDILGSRFSVGAYVKNLTDRDYYSGGFALTASLGVNGVATGQPRMDAEEVSYAF